MSVVKVSLSTMTILIRHFCSQVNDGSENYCPVPCSEIPSTWERAMSECLDDLNAKFCQMVGFWKPPSLQPTARPIFPTSPPPPPPPTPSSGKCRILCDDYGQLDLTVGKEQRKLGIRMIRKMIWKSAVCKVPCSAIPLNWSKSYFWKPPSLQPIPRPIFPPSHPPLLAPSSGKCRILCDDYGQLDLTVGKGQRKLGMLTTWKPAVCKVPCSDIPLNWSESYFWKPPSLQPTPRPIFPPPPPPPPPPSSGKCRILCDDYGELDLTMGKKVKGMRMLRKMNWKPAVCKVPCSAIPLDWTESCDEPENILTLRNTDASLEPGCLLGSWAPRRT